MSLTPSSLEGKKYEASVKPNGREHVLGRDELAPFISEPVYCPGLRS